MHQEHFIINGRYRVSPSSNTVSDMKLEAEVRIEPRLMKLLCILAEQPGIVVTREQLVKDIWNDYGGGEDGLTHSVSGLRKLLNDTSKTVIETIPKKGYVLNAAITNGTVQDSSPVPAERTRFPRLVLYAASLLLLAVIICGTFYLMPGTKTDRPVPQVKEVPYAEVNKGIAETWQNTITTTGPDSTYYKLVTAGDSRPSFYINGRLVSPDEMEKHATLIGQLKDALARRTAEGK